MLRQIWKGEEEEERINLTFPYMKTLIIHYLPFTYMKTLIRHSKYEIRIPGTVVRTRPQMSGMVNYSVRPEFKAKRDITRRDIVALCRVIGPHAVPAMFTEGVYTCLGMM